MRVLKPDGIEGVAMTVAYDAIADWYENEFLSGRSADGLPIGDLIGVDGSLRDLLGQGAGPSLEIGCGTGTHAARVRSLGWIPVGIDLSSGMLRHARGRLAIARADGEALPFGNASFPSVVSVMIHTDVSDYSAVLREAWRVLVPGGRFVHIGVHPCFCGGFADRAVPDAIVIRPGYLDGHWTKSSWTDKGLRDKVGATHLPLPTLLRSFVDAGFVLDSFREGGEPIPTVLAVRALKPEWPE
jgi:SAM-dependent methyltransferase